MHLFTKSSILNRMPIWDPINLKQAWRKVKEAKGAAGPDGITVEAFERDLAENLLRIQSNLRNGVYRPGAIRTVTVPKTNGGTRELGIINVTDRVVQRSLLNLLEPYFETRFLPCNFGFRPDRSVVLAIKRIKRLRKWGYRWVVDADVQSFFDSIDIELLHRFVARDLPRGFIATLLHRSIDAYQTGVTKHCFGLIRRPTGILQGSVVSPLLSNIYLHRFDQELSKRDRQLVRYADDFVVLSRTEKQAVKDLKLVKQVLAWLKLRVNEPKTKIVAYHDGFQFLGRQLGGNPAGPKAVTSKSSSARKSGAARARRDRIPTPVPQEDDSGHDSSDPFGPPAGIALYGSSSDNGQRREILNDDALFK